MNHSKILLLFTLLIFLGCSTTENAKQTQKTDTQSKSQTMTTASVNNKTKIESPEPVEEYKQKIVAPKDIIPPLQSIKDLDHMIENYQLGQNLTPEQIKNNKGLKQQIIRGTFDIKELCRLSLSKHWETITKEEQKHFVGLMRTLLETKAIFSKEQLKGTNKYYNIKYKNEVFDDKEKTKATVYTDMNVPKKNITLNITYKMLLTPYGWKIFDVIVDDASLLNNYKFQFNQIITTKGYNELITRMEKKLQEIKDKDKAKTKEETKSDNPSNETQ